MFCNGNRSFATFKGYAKPSHKNLSSKKVWQKSQLQVNTKKSILNNTNNITELKQSNQSLQNSDSASNFNKTNMFFMNEICNKPNTRISGVFLFGFDIDCLHTARIKAPTNRKHPYMELESNLQKNK
ncbi:42594_t:CDS:2 [Gigaspora margarita]|uniref:42594_t:CDS:1 n=1 Tax=Gigaspora margarita TaxID=4874 RepID=A0ABN7V8R2_GIGMA|nr:42594_t:CDS:2 [Gigaspora margarita]